jgi:hypothetical protein
VTDKILSALSPPAMTTAQRDAIPAGRRPKGSVIHNTTVGRTQVNNGTDAAPIWTSVLMMTCGVVTLAFAAAVFTPMVVVTHGLGTTPNAVVASGDLDGASSPTIDLGRFTATTFTIRAGDSQGVIRTGNQNVWWIAMG